jgi:hypothetical protein
MPYVLMIFQFYILFELNLNENVKKKKNKVFILIHIFWIARSDGSNVAFTYKIVA